tara:strand:+ start:793 stop:1035 length:243 start_codon:yes stop_codon:yes gene_type:complete
MRVGDKVTWKRGRKRVLRSGYYVGNHAYRLKQEGKPFTEEDGEMARVWPTRSSYSTRKVKEKIKDGVVYLVIPLKRLSKA